MRKKTIRSKRSDVCASHLVGLVDEVGDVCVRHSGDISVAAAAARLQCSGRRGRNTRRLLTSNLVQKTPKHRSEESFRVLSKYKSKR